MGVVKIDLPMTTITQPFRHALAGLILGGICLFGAPFVHAEANKKLDGIVLIISDGTSLELITTTRDYALGADGKLAWDQFPATAFVRTYSASDLVTDSSAGATAMARGIKAINGVVGQAAPDSASGPASILDLAKAKGWSTGVVSDDSVTGATPASFLVEHRSRAQYDLIADKILDQFGKRVDIVLGGGYKWFSDRSADPAVKYKENQPAQVRKNAEKREQSNVAYFDDWSAFVEARKGDKPVLGTFFPDAFPYYADGTRTLRLRDMVGEAVKFLKAGGKPYLLVAEAGLPDKACHANNAKRAITEVLELDATLDWLKKNAGPNVLIIVTTDHNTGGLIFNGPPAPLRIKGDALLGKNPVSEHPYLTWASGPGANPPKPDATPVAEDHFEATQPALLPRGSAYHTGGDVWLVADGPGSEAIHGSIDNTDIYRIIAKEISEN
ncbi:alkaline phosphatase [Terrimicrobium sacchariphilum]|uniref:Alkaline phosphatase n=1 Tax=Terrimicrobium sacchariphilum TaxID=690879 RepID=A0A146G795_TERSA|nr:alkaline phosphatase [Terrimicrobium sacchariphilum]GAT32784.1 alkaline phosphatase [Terrimicrobium sacchariphilum]